MDAYIPFNWDLLRPETQATAAQESLAREICETFLDTGAGIPHHQKKVELKRNRNLLDQLVQLGLTKNNANRYYPTFPALYYCRSGLRDSYALVLHYILRAIKALYESPSGPQRYAIKQIEQQTNLLLSTSPAQEIAPALKTDVHFLRATLFLKDFTRLIYTQDSANPDVPVDNVVATDNILDYEDLQQAWREELDARPRPSNPIRPGVPEQSAERQDRGAPRSAASKSEREETSEIEQTPVERAGAVPLSRLRDFSISSTTRKVFDYAIQVAIKRNPQPQLVTSSALLFAMVEVGRQSQDTVTPRFLSRWISEKDDQAYVSAYKGYVAEIGTTYADGSELMSSNALALLLRASEIAKETSQSAQIHSRHLLAALLVYKPGTNGRLKARSRLARMGFDLILLKKDFLRFLENTEDSLAAWGELLSTSDEETTRLSPEVTPATTENGPSTHVSRDRWTTEDSLDHFPYAYAIYRFLTDNGTRPPLAISIQAPWGGGKTSLMRMIQAQLDPEAAERAEHTNVRREQETHSATVANVKREIDNGDTKPSKRFAMPRKDENGKRRITVWFNTWKYESTEQVWAGLADCIVQQVGDRLGPVERELFWFRLHLRRFDAAKVRQRIHQQVTTRFLGDILPWLWAYVTGPVLALVFLLVGNLTGWAKLRGAGVVGLFLSGVGDLIAATQQAKMARSKVEAEPAAANFGDLVATPAYSANLGFVHEVVEDLKRVFEIIPENHLPMVIFIDDLDRCSPKKVAAVVEAINLFLAGEFPDCMFILGIDDEMVAAALDEAHSDVIARLPGYARSASMGWRFMDKFVQLPFAIPPSNANELNRYLDSLFPHSTVVNVIDIETRDRAARVVEAAQNSAKPVDQIVKEVSAAHPLGPSQQKALKRDVGIIQEMQRNIETFNDDEDGVKEIVAAQARKYFTNPRDVKRFINLFRFHFFLRAAREARGEHVPSVEQMLRWLALSLKWPDVVRWLRRETKNGQTYRALTILEELGGACDDIDQWRVGIEGRLALKGDKTPWLSDEGLLEFFHAESALTPLDRLSMCGEMGLW